MPCKGIQCIPDPYPLKEAQTANSINPCYYYTYTPNHRPITFLCNVTPYKIKTYEKGEDTYKNNANIVEVYIAYLPIMCIMTHVID